jgi:outer membrane protein TolC
LAERASHARTDLVPLASKVMIATLQQYNAMQIGAFDVLRERSHELQQELSALDLWEEAWIARLDLERLLLGATPQHRPMDGASRNRSHSTENDRGGHR